MGWPSEPNVTLFDKALKCSDGEMNRRIQELIQCVKFLLPQRREHGVLGTFRFSHGWRIADRIELCNHLICKYGLDSYLEIGTRDKSSMNEKILANRRASVDPDPRAEAEYLMTSDQYFAEHNEKFDIIFIDGLHTGEQVKRDIENSLAALKPRGFVLLHDLNPPTALHARETYEVDGEFPAWNGTSWEGFAWFRAHRSDLRMFVVDVDWGVGVIQHGVQELWDGPTKGYTNLKRYRKTLLNLISVQDFLRLF